MIEAIERQRNQLDRTGLRVAGIRRPIILIEVTHLGIAGPVPQPMIFPGIGNVEETIAKPPISLGQIAFGDPKQGVRRGSVGHRQGLKVESFSLSPLTQHFPVVANRVRGAHRALDHRRVEPVWPVESAQKLGRQDQARTHLEHLTRRKT